MSLRAISAALAIGIVLAGAAVTSRWLATGSAGAFVEPADAVYLALDCDTTTAGVQDACAYPSGTTSVQVDVVLGNTTASSFELGAFNFTVAASPQQVADPPAGIGGEFNANPDANDGALTPGIWACNPPQPDNDTDADPGVARSFLSCFNADADGPLIAAGSTLKIATIAYDTSDGPASLSFDDVSVGDVEGFSWVFCDGPSDACVGANFSVGSVETLTPTSTQTFTPTATPTFQAVMTPSGTPVGGVSDVVGLNSAMCTMGAIGFNGMQTIVAATTCGTLDIQQPMQQFVGCLRAVDVDASGTAECGEGVTFDDEQNQLLRPTAADFSTIDLDLDQVRPGQALRVIAFVDGDWPVLFETSAGDLVSPGQKAPSFLCYTPASDPDCDADPQTIGDGVVVAMLVPPADATGGSATVTVTQAGVSRTLQVNLTGPADHIELELVGGKDTIRTGATSCTDLEPPWDIDTLKALATNGITDEQKTVVFARVYDAFGHELTSAPLGWIPMYVPDGFETPDPLGGGSIFGSVTMDLGEAGIGALQVVCSRDAVGDLAFEPNYIFVLDPFPNSQDLPTVTIHVVDELPTATATASPTGTETAVPSATPVPTETHTPTSTSTPVATATNTATATHTPTSTSTPVATATNTATATHTPEATSTPASSATAEGAVGATRTVVSTQTAPPSETASATNTPVPTSTNTATPTQTPTASHTPVPTSTDTATPSVTATETPTATSTAAAATSTPTGTASATKTAVPTSTRTPRADRTSTPASTGTVVPAVTAVRSATPFTTVLASRATPPAGVVLPDTGDGGSGGGGAMPVAFAIVVGAVAIVGAGWRVRRRS